MSSSRVRAVTRMIGISRNCGIGLQPAANFDAAHFRHRNIQQDDVGPLDGNHVQCLLTAQRRAYRIALVQSIQVSTVTLDGDVIDDEYASHFTRFCASCLASSPQKYRIFFASPDVSAKSKDVVGVGGVCRTEFISLPIRGGYTVRSLF